jgi:uncharacterized DUF497 family protein
VRITYDHGKRNRTLAERGLDFEAAAKVFAGPTLTLPDERQDYGEIRYQTYGLLEGRLIMMVWTEGVDSRRVISMRRCNEREKKRFQARLA